MRLSKRGAATVFHLSKKFFSTRVTAVPRRLVPAFFCLLIVAGVVIPPLSAHALEQSSNTADPNRPMRQDYAGPLQPAGSAAGAAADAKPSGVVNQFNKSNTSAGSPVQSIPAPAVYKAAELPEKRTATSDVTRNKDGTLTKKNYFSSKYYQKDGKWQNIDTKLVEDKNAGDSGNVLGKAYGFVQSLVSSPTDFTVKNNDWQARFSPSDSPQGMVRVKKGNSQIGFVPQNAKKVAPVITTDKTGKQTVHYYDLWPGVNVEYVVLPDQVKENIVIKNKNAANKVSFKVTGASLKPGSASKTENAAYEVKGALNDEFKVSPSNLILNNFGFVSQGSGLKQEYKNGVLSVSVDKSYLQNLPDKAFPAVIDPGVYRSNFGSGYGNNYVSFKSDGYVCYSNECDLYSGGLYDSEWYLQYWRGAYFAPYDIFQQNPQIRLKNANLHLTQLTNTGYWTGTYDSHTFYAGHATCLSFNCLEGDSWNAAGTVSTSGNIDVTNIYQAMISRGDYGAWIMLGGEDGTDSSFKDFDPQSSYVDFTYVDLPPAPSFAAPVNNQVYVDPQASFKINPATNPNNGTALQYELMVSSSPGGAGTVISSGMINGQQWTIPDGILQDGSTYYVQARSYDPENALYGSWGGSVSFRIDSREGKDKTQTYDTLGPVSIDLATGNLTTSASSHTTSALGGSLGISLDYNSPLKSRQGLVGQYWAVPAGYSGNTIPSASPSVERVDQSVDFNWAYDSPQPGTITNDWFMGRWTGYFVAPSTGTYYFGGRNDDRLFVYVDGQEVYANGGCYGDVCYGSNGVNLTAGQIVPFKAEYKEETGAAFTHVYVKGAVSEQIIPQDWFRTGVRPKAQNHGLTGHYYNDDGSHNLDLATKTQFLSRTDPILSFNWGYGAPVAGAPADSYMVRWTGYVTAPVSGTYYFGMKADDGSRVTVNNIQVEENWALGGYDTKYGSSISLSAGQTVPITVDYFENIGNAYAGLYVKGAVPEQVVPSNWLSPSANVLPDGWSLGIDPDGSLNYDHIKVNQNSVVLTDSTGSTHEYTWNGSTYKPPVNEDGQLSRNSDGTFTMQDTDGRTYIFGSDGMLVSVTTPTDDLKPAALKYTYSGTPARITQITDGVDPSRYAKIYYSGDSQCGTPPAGFDTQTPAGMLCAVQTNDGRTTSFYYKDKQLARIAKPGNEYLDYQYQPVTDANNTIIAYRMSAIRDSLANDAVAAGVRTDDSSVLTQISYDAVGRASSVTAPAAQPNASRSLHTVEYLPGQNGRAFSRYNNGDHSASTSFMPGNLEITFGYVMPTGGANTRQIYSCKIGWDEFTSLDPNCEGQQKLQTLGYVYITPPTEVAVTPIYRCTVISNSDHFDSTDPGCEWQHTEYLLGYVRNTADILPSSTKQHLSVQETNNTITPSSEPNGYTRRIEYDSLYRTTKDTDIAGLSTTATYHPTKDLQYTTTDPTNLTSTTIYDDEDRAVASYGPAPSSWFASSNNPTTNQTDVTPISTYQNQVPKTTTSYDEGMAGTQVSWYNVKGNSLYGSPKLHTTGLYANDPTRIGHVFSETPPPFTPDSGMDGYGLTATAKLRFPQNGTYTFKLWHDDGLRLYIDDQLQVDDWTLRTEGTNSNYRTFSFNATANKPYRFRLDYLHTGTPGFFETWTSGPGIPDQSGIGLGANHLSFSSPDYGLTTSSTTYDSQTGNTVTQTNYGTNPELGLVQSVTENKTASSGNGTGNDQNLVTSYSYEQQGAAGSYNRQTAKYLPGANTANVSTATQYGYYGPTETRDNPCTTDTTETYKQAGMLKSKTEADPDNNPGTNDQPGVNAPRTTEQIYDDGGKIVASRYNQDPWTCTTLDTRGRAAQTVVPTINGRAGRTTTANYATGGNPLITTQADTVSGATTAEIDLLGRTVRTVDTFGNVSTVTYDSFGRVSTSTSLLGTETPTYDNLNRTTSYVLDGITYATIAYDQYSRVSSIQYPQATDGNGNNLKLEQVTRDDRQRSTGAVYRFSNNTTYQESLALSTAGKVLSSTDNLNGTQAVSTYTYDKANRLTQATIDNMRYDYGYTNPTTQQCSQTTTNLNSAKNSNRTTYSTTNLQTNTTTTSTYCYNNADQLISSTDTQIGTPTYDDHGNITQLAGNGNPITFTYDASDQNTAITQGTNKVEYTKNSNGSVLTKKEYRNNTLDKIYRNAANGSVLLSCSLTDQNSCTVLDKYLSLPGGVTLTLSPNNQDQTKQKIYSLKNFHGDTALTVNAQGTATSSVFMYDPFGQTSPSSTFQTGGYNNSSKDPSNSSNQALGWASSPSRKAESSELFSIPIIQMGARVYLPTIGRFLQVDPVEGGCANAYVYAGDPVNGSDYSGMSIGGIFTPFLEAFFTTPTTKPAPSVAFSKQNSFSGKPYRSPSTQQWDAYYKSRASKGLSGQEVRSLKQWNQAKQYNEKIQGQRNKQKRDKDDDHNNPTAPPNIGPNPYLSGGSDDNAASRAILYGGASGTLLLLWWGAKILSPLCGPGAPVCAVAL